MSNKGVFFRYNHLGKKLGSNLKLVKNAVLRRAENGSRFRGEVPDPVKAKVGIAPFFPELCKRGTPVAEGRF